MIIYTNLLLVFELLLNELSLTSSPEALNESSMGSHH